MIQSIESGRPIDRIALRSHTIWMRLLPPRPGPVQSRRLFLLQLCVVVTQAECHVVD